MKSKLRLKATGSSIITSTPPFANTMLADVSLFDISFVSVTIYIVSSTSWSGVNYSSV